MRLLTLKYGPLAVMLGLGVAFGSDEPLMQTPMVSVATPHLDRVLALPPARTANRAGDEGTATAAAAAVEHALDILAAGVRKQSDPSALRMAFQAYFRYRASHPGEVRKPYLYFVDFGLQATEPRGYVFDMDALEIVDGPFTVAHGRGSVRGGASVPTIFSNRSGSNATSLGLYLTQETYTFSGKSGGRRYTSVGMRLQGLSGSFNSAARQRGVVVHGAPYVTPEKAGRSEGCPAMEPSRARRLLPLLGNGSLVFHFSPNDRQWLRLDPWAGADIDPLPRVASRG